MSEPVIITFLYFLGSLLNAYVLVTCYNNITNKKRINLYDWLIMIVIAIVMVANNLFNEHNYAMIFSIISVMFMFWLIFKEQGVLLFFKTIFICTIVILVEFIVGPLLLITSGPIEYQPIGTQYVFKTIVNLSVIITAYLIFKTKTLSKIYIFLHTVFEHNGKAIVYFVSVGVAVSWNYYLYVVNYDKITNYIVSGIFFVLIILFGAQYLKQIHDNKTLSLVNKYLEEILERFKSATNDYRDLKHNIMNDFIFMKGIVGPEEQKLIDTKLEKYSKDYGVIDDIETVPKGLQGIIYVKAKKAKKCKVKFAFTSINSFNYKSINYKIYIDFYEILGIVLDNAIEAAKNTKEKCVSLTCNPTDEEIAFEVINTFSNDIDLNSIGEKNYSTKNRDSGIGLNYIYKLNRDIKIKYHIVNNLFATKITVKIK